jgi:hypothetical protein
MAVTRISAVVRTESGIPVLVMSILAVVFFVTMIAAFAYGLIQNRYVTFPSVSPPLRWKRLPAGKARVVACSSSETASIGRSTR